LGGLGIFPRTKNTLLPGFYSFCNKTLLSILSMGLMQKTSLVLNLYCSLYLLNFTLILLFCIYSMFLLF